MLDKLWKGRALAKAANKKQARTLTFESGKLKQLAAYFPIGRKLLYYPEYHAINNSVRYATPTIVPVSTITLFIDSMWLIVI